MYLYSVTIQAFIKRLGKEIHRIFQTEIDPILNSKSHKSLFIYKGKTYQYQITLFEDNVRFAYFHPQFFDLAFNKKLILAAHDRFLQDVIRHELAHFLCTIIYPSHQLPHGEEFKNICQKLGWVKSIQRASSELNSPSEVLETERSEQLEAPENKIARQQFIQTLETDSQQNQKSIELVKKVQKLLASGQSQNVYESQLAIDRANKLIREHNLSLLTGKEQSEFRPDLVYMQRILFISKLDALTQAIASIMQHFYVSVVFCRLTNGTAIEVIGTKENVEIAIYTAYFLKHEFEHLWKMEKIKNPTLSGSRDKNSFFRGIAVGYNQQILQAHDRQKTPSFLSSDSKQVTIIDIENNRALRKQRAAELSLVHPRLSSFNSQARINSKAYEKGIGQGKKLDIKKGLQNGQTTLLLNHPP